MRIVLPKVEGPPTEDWARQLISTLERVLDAGLTFTELTDTPISYEGHANQFVQVNPDETGLIFSDAPAGALTFTEYNYDSSTVAADPGDGDVRLSGSTFATTTDLYFSDLTTNSTDVSALLASLQPGDTIKVQNKEDASNYAIYTVTGPAIDNGTWFDVPVSYDSSSGPMFDNATTLAVGFDVGGAGGGGGTVDGGDLIPGSIPPGAYGPGSITGNDIAAGTIGPANFQPGVFQITTLHDEPAVDLVGAPWVTSGGWRDVVGVPVIIDSWVKAFSVTGNVGATAKQASTAAKVYVRVQFVLRWTETILATMALGSPTLTNLKVNSGANPAFNPLAGEWVIGMKLTGTGMPVGAMAIAVNPSTIQMNFNATVSAADFLLTGTRDIVLTGIPKLLGPRITKTKKAAAPAYNVNLQLTPAEIQAKAGTHTQCSVYLQVLPDKKVSLYRVPYSLLGIVIRAA